MIQDNSDKSNPDPKVNRPVSPLIKGPTKTEAKKTCPMSRVISEIALALTDAKTIPVYYNSDR